MILYIVFLICVYYEDITGVISHIKNGPDKRDNRLEISGEGSDLSFKFNGKITEFIYIAGLVFGMIRGPYSWVFALILFLAQIPKTQLWWVIVDALLSILLLTLVFLMIFQEQIFVIIDLITF